ncbi:MFS transporter [Telmatocola sphagniphila]|uniref:MFS transporter n=1 Tax=Telmatocola sphagniphila TaxID=1123043 RepID=A0A8E6B948_9BACT|nr:MFS transporter [Telmatocola sphagniphila]QVL33426.1 MFS transporter [Telmatocola sphagniphila]
MNSPSNDSTQNSHLKNTISLWQICVLLLTASTLNYMDRMALNQSAADIQLQFGLNNTQYGLLEGVFSFAFALGAFSFGWLVDRKGVYLTYPSVVLIWSLSGFLCGWAPSFTFLLLCRFSLGLFEAGNWPCGIVTTRKVFTPERRSLGNAFFQGGTALGAIITPLVILYCLHWRDPHRFERESLFRLLGSPIGGFMPAWSPAWPVPFQVIGLLGFAWVACWFLIVRKSQLEMPIANKVETAPEEVPWFREIFFQRRYWLLVLVIIAVNTTWHSFRAWLPLFLQKGHGYSREFMNYFTSLYYISAEIGSLSVGIVTLLLSRRGFAVHTSRMLVFFGCALLALLSVIAAFLPTGNLLLAVLLLIGFASLGLFPTYFSLSQEVSSRHQGKVTGSLGTINALFLAGLYPLQGWVVDWTRDYSQALIFAGIPPILAWCAVLGLWNSGTNKN